MGERGGIDADFVCPSPENGSRILQGSDSTTHRERNEQLGRGPANGIEQSSALLLRGGDIEQHDFISARGSVRLRQFRRISSVAQAHKLHALDDTAAVYVQASDDS